MVNFHEIVDQAGILLRRRGRVSYRALQEEFSLSDKQLEALKEELLFSEPEIAEVDGRGLVWVGAKAEAEAGNRGIGESETTPRPPIVYTPAHLAERIRAEQAAMELRGSANGERKTITALFADLKGSTALIEGLDPEEARTIIDPALQLMMDAVHQYEGFVAQALGDGIFALFGAPIAHEDHPQRAVYAALRMQEEMQRYSDTVRQQGYPPLLMRVGLNTGEVVLRSIRKDDLHADYVPVGHSTNLAARMEQLATPGSIVVSACTHRLTDGYFAFKDLGPTQIKGVEEPLPVYEVLGAGPLRTRLQVSASRYGLTRFVGRRSELEQLQRAWEQAKAGQGQIVGVMGEPGLGKSRLFHEFKLLSLSGNLVLEAFAVSHGKASPYLPIIELLKDYFDIQTSDDERKRQEKVTGKVLNLDRGLEDTLPYLCSLLGIDDQHANLQQMDAQIRRRRTFEALKRLFLRESLNQPFVLIFEDLHWIDGETQGFLDILNESVASAKILVLTNYRPEYRHEWGSKTYYTQLRLAPFGKQEEEEFLEVLLDESPRPAGEMPVLSEVEGARVRGNEATFQSLKQLVLEKTDGTPFFMEEIVQELREQGVLTVGATGRSPLPTDLQIPTTVQAVLAARIDRLASDEKTLLQQLSVIGRQFPVSLVKAVVAQPEAELFRVLSSLQAKEFLYEQPAFPETEYLFKHALTRDVACGTVLQEQRKALHERTGQAMESLYQESLDEYYSELAYHYRLSGNTEKAVEYLTLAGDQAVQRAANTEAVDHLSAAIDLLSRLPASRERAEQAIELHITLANPLEQLHGWGASEVEETYSRARALCQQHGQTAHLFPVLRGLWDVYMNHDNLSAAYGLAIECKQLAEKERDGEYWLWTHFLLGITELFLGELHAAQTHFEEGLALYQNQDAERSTLPPYSIDPGWGILADSAITLWLLGYPQQAVERMEAAHRLAAELSDLFHTVMAPVWTAWLYQLRGEGSPACRWADEGLRLSSEKGMAQMRAMSLFLRGWGKASQARAAEPQLDEGICEMREVLAASEASSTKLWRPHWLALLAEVYGKTGEVQTGLDTLSQAVAEASIHGKVYYRPELERVRGELLLQQSLGNQSKAESCFHQAIAIAQKQQAKSWELRAAMSLARLWRQQGKTTEARELLAPVYSWFTEGFDTADLQDAKALLNELEP